MEPSSTSKNFNHLRQNIENLKSAICFYSKEVQETQRIWAPAPEIWESLQIIQNRLRKLINDYRQQLDNSLCDSSENQTKRKEIEKILDNCEQRL